MPGGGSTKAMQEPKISFVLTFFHNVLEYIAKVTLIFDSFKSFFTKWTLVVRFGCKIVPNSSIFGVWRTFVGHFPFFLHLAQSGSCSMDAPP